jgi:SAM-dependent methyltransferase
MLFGIPIILKCPNCPHLVLRQTVVSSNTLGAKCWSDGRVIFPMRPEYEALLLNVQDDRLFWEEECEVLGYYDEEERAKYGRLEFATPPTAAHLLQALQTPWMKDPHRACYLRTKLMWAYNNRRRFSGEKSRPDSFERDNLTALWNLTKDDPSIDSQVLCAEILRELSRFDEALAFLRLIPSDDRFNGVLELIYEHAERQDPVVLEVPPEQPLNRKRERRRLVPPAWKAGAKMPASERLAFYDRMEQATVSASMAEVLGLGHIDGEVISRHVTKNDQILDAGCGTGRVAIGLWQAGYHHVAACDFAPAQLAKAKERAARMSAAVSITLGDLQALPYDNASLDVVTCLGNTFDELSTEAERAQVIAEFSRVLRPGGTLICSQKCSPASTETDCILQLPRIAYPPNWNGGLVNRDIRYASPSQTEIEHFGHRVFTISTRL